MMNVPLRSRLVFVSQSSSAAAQGSILLVYLFALSRFSFNAAELSLIHEIKRFCV